MRCNSNMPDKLLPFEILHLFVHTASVSGPIAACWLVKLIYVYVIGFQHFQRCFELAFHFIGRFCSGFSCYIYFITHIRKSDAYFFFTVWICSCCVKKRHAAFIGSAEYFWRCIKIITLYRKRAESVLRNCNTRTAECNHFHICISHPSLLWIIMNI